MRMEEEKEKIILYQKSTLYHPPIFPLSELSIRSRRENGRGRRKKKKEKEKKYSTYFNQNSTLLNQLTISENG
jgi:hypothetical protein